ncbi:MAG: prepilin-type N-terminal cleavage/methylation domain-containing protein [Candidatus Magnetoovum sp. WYHC-5]|nr:prepilin-type N-terminal cleavage/methylation domain-containing protein [Candidatus Magnetoovum sp. WYHC-5]
MLKFTTENKSVGFTLLEVLIALSIISVLLTTIIYTVNHHLSILERHKTITIATMLAKEKLNDLLNDKNISTKESFPPPFANYYYEIKEYDTTFTGVVIKELRVNAGKEVVVLKAFYKK